MNHPSVALGHQEPETSSVTEAASTANRTVETRLKPTCAERFDLDCYNISDSRTSQGAVSSGLNAMSPKCAIALEAAEMFR